MELEYTFPPSEFYSCCRRLKQKLAHAQAFDAVFVLYG